MSPSLESHQPEINSYHRKRLKVRSGLPFQRDLGTAHHLFCLSPRESLYLQSKPVYLPSLPLTIPSPNVTPHRHPKPAPFCGFRCSMNLTMWPVFKNPFCVAPMHRVNVDLSICLLSVYSINSHYGTSRWKRKVPLPLQIQPPARHRC